MPPTSGPATIAPPPASLPPGAVAIDEAGSQGLVAGIIYTSRLFVPSVTFQVSCREDPLVPGCIQEFCAPTVSPHLITLARAKACTESVQIIRALAVECAGAAAHPGRDELVGALLANAALGAQDLGGLGAGSALPPALFLAPYDGRVIRIPALTAPNPTGRGTCRVLTGLGSSDKDVDLARPGQVIVFLEIGGELVLVRAQTPGGGRDGAEYLLGIIHEIRFYP